jgi:hypothetical protein
MGMDKEDTGVYELEPIELEIEPFVDGSTYQVDTRTLQRVWRRCASIYGVRFCVSLKVYINGVYACVSIAGYERCFGIGGNGCFNFEYGIARLRVCITNFRRRRGRICFELVVRACVGVKIPFDGTLQKCKTIFREEFCIPFFRADLVTVAEMSEEDQLRQLQVLSSLLEEE